MRTLFLAFVAFTLSLTGCADVAVVGRSKGDGTHEFVPGIPFFVKKKEETQVTVYRQTWLRVRLAATTKLLDSRGDKATQISVGAQEFVRDILKPQDAGANLKSSLFELQ
jgi:hypothetical protein|nr:MAG: hypothetical protein DIU57_17645 [Pseudomonadota bacterium]